MTFIVVGGGAAGFFAALAAKEANPHAEVVLLERSNQVLSKVKISGGGRCNVTHACFEPKELIKNYPRGSKELLGPFSRFQPLDTIHWFESRGVQLKTESDGRMFPVSDDSQTIIDCLLKEAKKQKILIRTKTAIDDIEKTEDGFTVTISDGEQLKCNSLLIATGSQPSGIKIAVKLGHSNESPVPSLFTFNVPTSPLKDLAGVAVEKATLLLEDTNLEQTGPLLITHWGFSGPAALKLSAWGARHLSEKNYRTRLIIDWIPHETNENLLKSLKKMRTDFPSQTLINKCSWKLPKSLWRKFLELSQICEKRLSEISNDELLIFCSLLKTNTHQIEGKTTHKEEFVTCGGIKLNEIHFKTMESKLCSKLFFAGEVLDIDAVTGGFNFQNAWTTGWIAGTSAGKGINHKQAPKHI